MTKVLARLASVRRFERLSARVVGQNVFQHERIYAELYAATRPAAGGVVALAMGAIENALLDAKAKLMGVPCYELLGGKIRDRIRVYWSHCATWRINHPTWYKPPIESLDGVKAIGREVREKNFSALKTNIFIYDNGKPTGWRPGFGSPFQPEINVERKVLRDLRMHLEAIRDGAGPDVDILLDLNFNAKTEGYLKILREIEDLDMFWIEIDTYNPEALGLIRRQSPHPIIILRDAARLARVHALFPRAGDGCGDHRHAMERRLAVDEDRGRCGGLRGQRRAAQFLRPSVHDDERALLRRGAEPAHHGDRHRSPAPGTMSCSRTCRTFEDGHLVLPDRPGWGTEPNEEAIRAHPPKGTGRPVELWPQDLTGPRHRLHACACLRC